MRILFVVRSIVYAGASKMAVAVANSLQEHGHKVAVATYNNNKIGLKLNEGIEFYPGKVNSKLTEYAYAIMFIRKTIKDFEPQVIFGFRDNAAAFCIVASLGTHIPIIVCERSDPYMETNFSLKISRKLFRYAAGAVFQTEGAQKYYKGIVKKSVVIPNPVTSTAWKCSKKFAERKNEIAFVARLHILQKRHDILFNAFKIVTQTHPEMKLVLYGDGADREKLEQLAVDMNLADKIVFMGKVDNVYSYLVETKMFVLSSDYEGISNALIEAMSIGLPCISTDTSPGGARVLIEDGKNGFIVPRRDVKALADKMLYLIEHPEDAEMMGQLAKNISVKYAPSKIFDMWNSYALSFLEK